MVFKERRFEIAVFWSAISNRRSLGLQHYGSLGDTELTDTAVSRFTSC